MRIETEPLFFLLTRQKPNWYSAIDFLRSARPVKKHAIYLITDLRFSKMTGALAERLAQQWGCDVHVFVEDRNAAFAAIPGAKDIHVHFNRIKFDLPDTVPGSENWPSAGLLRIYAPSLLPDYDRLLYLDIDILCEKVDHSLWDIDLPHGIGAVSDAVTIDQAPHGTGLSRAEWLDRIGVASGRYFNSGMMVIDPARWDIAVLRHKLSGYFGQRAIHGTKSQDFINHALDGRWTELSPRWNFQPPFFELGLDAWVDPVFLHFCTPIKPWLAPDRPGVSDPRIEHERAFFRIRDDAAINPSDTAATSSTTRFKAFGRKVRRVLSTFGIQTGKERRKRASWRERRAKMSGYLRNAQRDRIFADPLAFDSEPPSSGVLRFDGCNLRFDPGQSQHAPSRRIGPADRA